MIYILFSAVIIAADQMMKGWVISNIPIDAEVVLIPGIVRMTHTHNPGAAFSLFRGMQPIIIIITLLFCVIALMGLILRAIKSNFGNISLAMILGGALGNFIDRINSGYVVDMFDFVFIKFAVFNIADIFITFGALSFCLFVILTGRNESFEPLWLFANRKRGGKTVIKQSNREETEAEETKRADETPIKEKGSSQKGEETVYDPDNSGT